jgi:hypothetical protein
LQARLRSQPIADTTDDQSQPMKIIDQRSLALARAIAEKIAAQRS